MALTATLVSQTPYKQRWLIDQDGAAGQAVTITAAQLLAAALAGPLREMPGIGSDVAALDQAGARKIMLGQGAAPGEDLTNTPHAFCSLTPVAGDADIVVDADVDGVNALRCELNLSSGAAAGQALLEIAFQHTYDR